MDFPFLVPTPKTLNKIRGNNVFNIYSWIDSFDITNKYEGRLLQVDNWLNILLNIIPEPNKTQICSNKLKIQFSPSESGKVIIPDNNLVIVIDDKSIIYFPWNDLNPNLNEQIMLCNKNMIPIHVVVMKIKSPEIIETLNLRKSVKSVHVNALLIDKNNKTIELFDPYGKANPIAEEWIKSIFVEKAGLIDYRYISSMDICPISGPQTIAEKYYPAIKTEKGFCHSYSIMYFHMRLSNPGLDPKINLIMMLEKTYEELRLYVTKYTNILHFIYGYPFR